LLHEAHALGTEYKAGTDIDGNIVVTFQDNKVDVGQMQRMRSG
jgi:hypothetical protein